MKQANCSRCQADDNPNHKHNKNGIGQVHLSKEKALKKAEKRNMHTGVARNPRRSHTEANFEGDNN